MHNTSIQSGPFCNWTYITVAFLTAKACNDYNQIDPKNQLGQIQVGFNIEAELEETRNPSNSTGKEVGKAII